MSGKRTGCTNEWSTRYDLTETEKIWLGLKKPAPLRGTIQIVIPEHYGSKGVMWTSRFVTEAQLDSYLAQYPGMQILDERYKVRKKEPEPEQEQHEPEIDYDDNFEERWEFYR